MADSVIVEGGSQLFGDDMILTGVVQNLPDSAVELINVTIQSKLSNSDTVYIVDTNKGNEIAELAPGFAYSADVNNLAVIRVKGTNGDEIYWSGLIR